MDLSGCSPQAGYVQVEVWLQGKTFAAGMLGAKGAPWRDQFVDLVHQVANDINLLIDF